MAWNPSPEVQVARDAAKALGAIKGVTVDRCIINWTSDSGKVGYSSFGLTSKLCGEARRMGDVVYDALIEHYERTMDAHDREKLIDPAEIDFEGIERETVKKIRLLASVTKNLPIDERRRVYRDLIAPCLGILMRFDMAVSITE